MSSSFIKAYYCAGDCLAWARTGCPAVGTTTAEPSLNSQENMLDLMLISFKD